MNGYANCHLQTGFIIVSITSAAKGLEFVSDCHTIMLRDSHCDITEIDMDCIKVGQT
jgi:hypothetical protein